MPSTLGITSSSYAFPIVSGGTLTSDATYYYRTFTANGSLVIQNQAINMDYWIVGGGGGGSYRSVYYPYLWQGYYDTHLCEAGGAGGAGADLNSGSNTFQPDTINIFIGAGGAALSGGYATDVVSANALFGSLSAFGGTGAGGPQGGFNNYYAAGNVTYYLASPAYITAPAWLASSPYYWIGSGGAGAAGSGSGPNGGAASTSVPGRSVGGGGAGAHGNYAANDYLAFPPYDYYPNYGGTTVGTPGTNGGTASTNGNGGNGVANTGSGGGGATGAPGNGGSGVVVFRYQRSVVGG